MDYLSLISELIPLAEIVVKCLATCYVTNKICNCKHVSKNAIKFFKTVVSRN